VTLVTLFVLSRLWKYPSIQAYHYMVLLLGAVAAILLHNRRTFNILRFLMNPIAGSLLFACVIVMQTYVIHIPSIAGPFGGPVGILIYGVVVAIFLPTLLGKSPINSMLKSRPFVFVGHRSYSLYLFHFLAAQAVLGMDPLSSGSLSPVLTTIVGLIFADCVYRWVESPAIRVGKRLASKWTRDARMPESRLSGSAVFPASSSQPVVADVQWRS
jgi:peptidoglycan/LPS O-acetylase OafA/YrhL